MADEGREDPSTADEVNRAQVFAESRRGCLQGCVMVFAVAVLVAVVAYIALALYLVIVYHRHPY